MTAKESSPTDPASTFESHLSALEALVEKLERGDVPLAEAMAAYEEGLQAAQQCETLLQDAQARLDALAPGEAKDAD